MGHLGETAFFWNGQNNKTKENKKKKQNKKKQKKKKTNKKKKKKQKKKKKKQTKKQKNKNISPGHLGDTSFLPGHKTHITTFGVLGGLAFDSANDIK